MSTAKQRELTIGEIDSLLAGFRWLAEPPAQSPPKRDRKLWKQAIDGAWKGQWKHAERHAHAASFAPGDGARSAMDNVRRRKAMAARYEKLTGGPSTLGLQDRFRDEAERMYRGLDPAYAKAEDEARRKMADETAAVRKRLDLLLVSVKAALFQWSELAATHSLAEAWSTYQTAINQSKPDALGTVIQDLERIKAKLERQAGKPAAISDDFADVEGVPAETAAAPKRCPKKQRDFDAFVLSAKRETSTKSFRKWAGGERVTLAIVFTDVVGSTALAQGIGDEGMKDVLGAHFAQTRKLIARFQGWEIKTIGDRSMGAFKSVEAALDFTLALQSDTGHPQVKIRAGIHIGPMDVKEDDVYGSTVSFADRVVGANKGAGIWLSDEAKKHIDMLGASRHKQLKWVRHKRVAMKGLSRRFTLWSL